MLRGENLYPTVVEQWLADIHLGAPRAQQMRLMCRAFQRRLDERYGPGARRFDEIDAHDIAEFVDIGDNGRPRADRTRYGHLGALNRIYIWALDSDIALATHNPAARLYLRARGRRLKPAPDRRKVWLGEERAGVLISTAAGRDSQTALRDAFLLRLALYTGMRASELIGLRWRDVDLAGGFITVLGKGGKIAPVAIVPALRKALLAWRTAYVEGLGHDRLADLPVLCRCSVASQPGKEQTTKIHWGKPIRNTATVRRAVYRCGAAIGVELAPHDLRRSWAGILKDRGKTDEEIRKALRHEETSTTRIYLEDKPEQIDGLEDLDFG